MANEAGDVRIHHMTRGEDNEYEVQAWQVTIGASGYWKTEAVFGDYNAAYRFALTL